MVTLLLCSLGARAAGKVVFKAQFDSQPTDPTAVGFYEFVNNEDGDTRDVAEGILTIFNSDGTLDTDSWWRRAIKFRNLPLVEGKTYRLDFKLMGTNRYEDGVHEGDDRPRCQASAALMQGEDDYDIALLDFNGNEQRASFDRFNESAYESYSANFVFASEAMQKEKYAEKGKGELADKFFLTLNVFNPGNFQVKDLVLSEVGAVQSVGFGTLGAIKVDFGANTNIAAMAEAAPKGLVMFDEAEVSKYASATVNGAPAEIEAIEYHKDGALYVFLVDAVGEEDKIVVNFTNPTDERQIKYVDKETEASTFDVVEFDAEYNAGLDGDMSFAYLPPELISSYPANKAFAIDVNLSEFSFTFDHEIVLSKVSATLDCGGTIVPLTLKTTGETAETVVFVRQDNGVLAKNNTITVSGAITVEDAHYDDPYVITFEAGKPKVAEEIITPVQTIDFTNDEVGKIPLGWTLYFNYESEEKPGELRPSGSAPTSGPRMLFANGFYVRADGGKQSRAFYGDLEGYAVTLPVGDLHIDFIASGYKAAGKRVLCEVLDATGQNVLASKEVSLETVTPDGGPVKDENMQKITVAYKNETEQNAILRYTVFSGGGMDETILTGIVVNTYEVTEGDIPNDKEILVDPSFGGAGNNRSPKAESGWELWQDGEMRAFDTDFNYKGTRIFNDLALKGLAIGYYCNGQWPNGFMQYGAASGEGAPKLTLAKATHDFTLYAANWKEDIAREIHVQVLDESGEKVYLDKVFNTSPVNMAGSRSANYEADKFTFSWDCPAEGNYIVRFGSPAGETLIGNFSLIQPGSRAVKYYSLLAQTVANAKAALEKVADPMYDGAAKTALEEGVAKYEDPDKITMTTEEEFKAAIEELEGLTKSMLTRYEYIPRFKTAYESANKAYTGSVGTKYEKLEAFEILGEVLATYEGVDPSTLEDEDLIGATTSLENNTTLFNNMKNTCVGLLTKQIIGLANQLVALDETKANNKYVIAANNAITDDQEIAYQLKLRIAKAIYDKCAAGDPFVEEQKDPETGEPTGITVPVEIDVTNFIQNAGFYCTDGWPGTVNGFPGWTIELIAGKVGPSYGISSWAGERASELKPVVEASIRTDWGTHEHDAKQFIDMLPIAKSTVSIIVGEDGGEPHEAYAYVGEGEAKVVKYYDGEAPGEEGNKFDRDTNIPRVFADVTPELNETAILGKVLLGAHGHVNGGFSRIDNATIKLTAKVEGFDYAAAAARLATLIDDSTIKGDVNGDGVVDGADIQEVINTILSGKYVANADVNEDQVVDGADIQEVINVILSN